MQKARAELGDDARLVSARRVSSPGVPPVYEVRVTAQAPAPATTADSPALGELRQEILDLKHALSSMATPAGTAVASPSEEEDPSGPAGTVEPAAPAPDPGTGDPELAPWAGLLRRRGVGEAPARAILETAGRHLAHRIHAEARDAVRGAVADTFGPVRRRDLLGDRPTLFVGPTGAGKTTTLAKVAAELVAGGERPVLVCADGESLTGEENLQAIATALGLQFEVAFLTGQLEAVVERLGEDRIYLVDTAGQSPSGSAAIEGLRSLAGSLADPEVLPVLPATADTEEVRLALRAFAPLGPERVVLTKMDEMIRPGRLVDLALSLSVPVVRVTYGRGVRGSAAHPGTEPIVSRILGSELRVETSA